MKFKILCFWGSVCLILGIFYTFGSEEVMAADTSVTLYHKHIESPADSGGCNGAKKSEIRECGSYNLSIGASSLGGYTYRCGQCGYTWNYPHELPGAKCQNKVSLTYYEKVCGLDGKAVAVLSCSKSADGWVREMDLTAACEILDASCSPSGYIWNGAEGGNTLHVTQNGAYALQLKADDGTDTSPVLSITVDHIDNQPPAILHFTYDGEGYARQKELHVEAQDTESGLAAQPYSFDGGVSWTDNPVYVADHNGSYTVTVRDAAGNQSVASLQVSGIDRTAPEVQVITSPSLDAWYDGVLTITVQARDGESGLSEQPYSFDGGNHFGSSNTYRITSDCNLTIVVSDRVGNRKTVTLSAYKKARPQANDGSDQNASGGSTSGGNIAGEEASSGGETSAGDSQEAGKNGQNGNNGSNANARTANGGSGKTANAGASNGAKDTAKDTGNSGNARSAAGRSQEDGKSGHTKEKDEQGIGILLKKESDIVYGGGGKSAADGSDGLVRQHYPLLQTPTLLGILADTEQIYIEEINIEEIPEEETMVPDIETENIDSVMFGEGNVIASDRNTGTSDRLAIGGVGISEWLKKLLLPGSICMLAAGLLLLIPLLINGCGVRIYAKGADGKFRLVGITRMYNKEHKKLVHLRERMIKRAQTNDFKLHLPTLMEMGEKEKKEGRIVVICRTIRRELPAKRIINLRLRCE